MGTTTVAVLERNGLLSVAHVGDSRLYLFANNQLRQLTEDDSWAASVLARDPQMDPAALQNHPMRNALTGGELLALTTDGVHGVLSDMSLTQMMGHGDSKRIATELIDAALSNG